MNVANFPNITVIGTLSLLELLWLLVALPGLVYAIANALDSRVDKSALRESGQATSKDWIIARQRARHATIGAGIEASFVLFGLASAFTPNPPAVSWLAYVISALLIGGSLALTWGAWRDSQDRRSIRTPDSKASAKEEET